MTNPDETATIDVPRQVPPLVLIAGPEAVLAERALAQVIADVKVSSPEVEVLHQYTESYEPGAIAVATSPSLFGEETLLVVHDLDEAPEAMQTDLLEYLGAPEPDVTLVVMHKSGNRGKKVLDTLKKGKALRLGAPAMKSDRDKTDFATNEFRRLRRKATAGAVAALVQAVGKDPRELASACQQLVDDTTGVIDDEVVMRYHGGKVEATGFQVAEAAIAGQADEALRLWRHAAALGESPVPILAVLALQLRQLAKVGAAGRGRSADVARALKMAPWQVDKARRALQGWDGGGIGRSIQAVAQADFEVKGGGLGAGGRREPAYVLERCILEIVAERESAGRR
ncbi:DNA polymerase III subunit delta [Kribbia dieselivorans]|uniref:DNA polymerase III subunit delta n=1 Tax=Kribbia dieselivorans TaxID=331526 RepID=UPI001FDF036E|nr:DNA polymerase III subunit delta [Kribbia dieselivorans]